MREKMKWKTFIRAYSIMVLMALTIFGSMKTSGTGHGIRILSPLNNMKYTNVYHRALDASEQTVLTFSYKIQNEDGYYAFYETYVDGVYDENLMDEQWTSNTDILNKQVAYDGQTFLERYGQGEHTFAIWSYHRVLDTIGLAEGSSSGDDIVQIGIYKYRVFITSVTFVFDPIVVHYLGFWFENETDTYALDILGFKELLCDANAHYLHGHFYYTGSWSASTVYSAFKELNEFEDSNDIDIIAFSSHGVKFDLGRVKLLWGMKGTSGYYDPDDLETDLERANFDSQNILLLIECCYSEMFLMFTEEVPNVTTMCSASLDEGSYCDLRDSEWTPIKPSWSIDVKIGYISSDFLRAIAQASYSGLNLRDGFNNLGDYDYFYHMNNANTRLLKLDGHISQEQHPKSSSLTTWLGSIHLYVNCTEW